MANYDIFCLMEYFSNRADVPATGRSPVGQWQNFFQEPQTLGSQQEASGQYQFLAFDAEGFGSSEGSAINDVQVTMAATAEMMIVTENAMDQDNLIIIMLFTQSVGQDSIVEGTFTEISRYIGTLNSATATDETISWTINPAVNKMDPQVPPKKISADMLNQMRQRLK